jgi:hypothetical protein
MTIRTRLTLWYAVIMFIALTAMGILLYEQLIIEPRREARQHQKRDNTEQMTFLKT